MEVLVGLLAAAAVAGWAFAARYRRLWVEGERRLVRMWGSAAAGLAAKKQQDRGAEPPRQSWAESYGSHWEGDEQEGE